MRSVHPSVLLKPLNLLVKRDGKVAYLTLLVLAQPEQILVGVIAGQKDDRIRVLFNLSAFSQVGVGRRCSGLGWVSIKLCQCYHDNACGLCQFV